MKKSRYRGAGFVNINHKTIAWKHYLTLARCQFRSEKGETPKRVSRCPALFCQYQLALARGLQTVDGALVVDVY